MKHNIFLGLSLALNLLLGGLIFSSPQSSETRLAENLKASKISGQIATDHGLGEAETDLVYHIIRHDLPTLSPEVSASINKGRGL